MNPITDAFIDKSLGRLNIIKENYDLMALREIIKENNKIVKLQNVQDTMPPSFKDYNSFKLSLNKINSRLDQICDFSQFKFQSGDPTNTFAKDNFRISDISLPAYRERLTETLLNRFKSKEVFYESESQSQSSYLNINDSILPPKYLGEYGEMTLNDVIRRVGVKFIDKAEVFNKLTDGYTLDANVDWNLILASIGGVLLYKGYLKAFDKATKEAYAERVAEFKKIPNQQLLADFLAYALQKTMMKENFFRGIIAPLLVLSTLGLTKIAGSNIKLNIQILDNQEIEEVTKSFFGLAYFKNKKKNSSNLNKNLDSNPNIKTSIKFTNICKSFGAVALKLLKQLFCAVALIIIIYIVFKFIIFNLNDNFQLFSRSTNNISNIDKLYKFLLLITMIIGAIMILYSLLELTLFILYFKQKINTPKHVPTFIKDWLEHLKRLSSIDQKNFVIDIYFYRLIFLIIVMLLSTVSFYFL